VNTIDLLKSISKDVNEPLSNHAQILHRHSAETEHVDLVEITKHDKSGKLVMAETYLQVCGCKAGFSQNVKNALFMYQNLYDRYGERARMAQQNNGVDWKALMHAVRVCHEAIELLSTGNITFPRPEAPLLLKIRKGEMQYSEVSQLIVDLLEQVTAAEQKSTLRKKPDMAFIEELTFETYRNQILK